LEAEDFIMMINRPHGSHNFFRSAVAFFTLIAFVFTNCIWSPDLFAAANVAALPLSEEVSSSLAKVDTGLRFSIPTELGTIEEFNHGRGPALIHIQTAHGHYQAQQQIRKILHHLDDSYGINTLLVEGSAF